MSNSDGLPYSLHPMSSVMPKTFWEQEVAQIVDAQYLWSLHHIVWQGTAWELRYNGELFEEWHWRDYQRRLKAFEKTGMFEKAYGG